MPTAGELYRAFDSDPKPVVDFLRWQADVRGLGDSLRVLDVGCGVGRLAAPLTGLGWRVTAMEPNASYRAIAEAACRKLTGVEVRMGGFNDIGSVGSYDMVLGINGSFAYLRTPDERLDALDRCRNALKPHGLLVLDLPNMLWILRNYREPVDQTRQVGLTTVMLRRRHLIDWQRATFTTRQEYRAVGKGSTLLLQEDHVYAITSLPELTFLLAEAGFDEPDTYRGFDSRRPEPIGEGRMLLVARPAPETDD
ncbi:MAG: class I SAM-dependent methyltransferase [Gemmatimonadota bacterium]|jgi:SAM-dependent methyltransferase